MYIIKENKQVGTLYHYTDANSLLKILKDMKLKDISFDRGYISFTRYGNGIEGQGKNFTRLVLDGDTLSNKYTIVPDSQARSGNTVSPYKPSDKLQGEERIYKKEVDIKNSLIRVDIIKSYANLDFTKAELEFIRSVATLNIIEKFTPYR